jgi:GNAT superfamily N-acetyltransferase
MDDADLNNPALEAGVEVVCNQLLYFGRSKRMQVQNPVNGKLDRFVHSRNPTKDLLLQPWLLPCRIDIKIRQANPADAPTIAEFNQRLAMETENLYLDPACINTGVAAVLADPSKGIYYVAEVNGALIGQLMITYEWSDWRNGNLWWIQSVYVKREFRRKGVFRELFKHLEVLARHEKDVRALRLYMHSDNSAARQSYERQGMRRTKYEVFELEFDPAHQGGG